MSLNWNADKNTDENFLTIIPIYKGKEQESTMHPILHRLIFLTMRLGCDLTRNPADVVNRIGILRTYQPDLVTLQYGDDADTKISYKHAGKVLSFLEYYPNAFKTKHGWNVPIDADWITRYWGLSTNADRIPFKKWANREAKIKKEEMKATA